MHDLLEQLSRLHAHKMRSPERYRSLAKQQLKIIRSIRARERKRELYARSMATMLAGPRAPEHLQMLMDERTLDEHMFYLFHDELTMFSYLLSELDAAVHGDARSEEVFPEDLEIERALIGDLIVIWKRMSTRQNAFRAYLNDLMQLEYDKRSIRKSRRIARLTRSLIHIEGSENVPEVGPCIIAPTHPNAILDPLVLMASLERTPFFILAAEAFLLRPRLEAYLKHIGCLPYKRDDGLFGPRKPRAIPAERVAAYPADNASTLNRALLHLKLGDTIVAFPEGDAHAHGTFQRENAPFLAPKNLFIIMAYFAQRRHGISVPIIPTALSYPTLSRPLVRFGKPIILDERSVSLPDEKARAYVTKMAAHVFSRARALIETK